MELLRSGNAHSLIRRKAAEGNLPASLEDKIGILITLCRDPEESTRRMALTTLKNWEKTELKQIFSNPKFPARKTLHSPFANCVLNGRSWRRR